MAPQDDFGSGRWDLHRVFSDEPKGAYLNMMKPLIYADYLTYPETAPERLEPTGKWNGTIMNTEYEANASSLGKLDGQGGWHRLWQIHQDHKEGGTHMFAIVNEA